jgi:thiamine-phosphate pyrophosphorylase
MADLTERRLYLVLDARPHGNDAAPILEAALSNGVDVVQLREKSLDDDAVLEAARTFRRLCDRHDALFFVNDRPDLAVAAGADGVHLGQEDLSPEEARSVLGPSGLVGISTHSPEQLRAASADYVSVGPVWETPTKPGRRAVGLELVDHAARHAEVPFFAIGGIDTGNAAEVLAAGATRLAVVRAIRDASSPGDVAAVLRAEIDAAAGAPAPLSR